MVWVVECTLCNSLMWNIKYAVEPCSIVESIIHFRLLQKKISKNSQKISQKFVKKLKVFSQIPKKVWILPRIDESNIQFLLVSLRLDSLEIRKNQILKKKCFHLFELSKLAQKCGILIFFAHAFVGNCKESSKFQSEITIRKQKFWKKFWPCYQQNFLKIRNFRIFYESSRR